MTGFKNLYSEFVLGEESRARLLHNFISAIGFSATGAEEFRGLSGLKHRFEAVGWKDKNILLVVGGAERQYERFASVEENSPRKRMEQWRNIALLSSYDVQHALLRDGLIVDLMFFHNISNTADFPEGENIREWSEKNKLPRDISFSWTGSMDPIPTLATDELVSMAQSVGASFLTLNDLALHEVSTLSHATDDVSVALARDIAKRIRLAQYFSPPTDELVLSAYDMSKSHDSGLVREAYDMAVHLGHIPSENVVVKSGLFKDPEATAKELEKHKYISFESTIELSSEGQRVTQTIRKSSQGSFIIRILSTIGLPALAKAIIQAVKGE